MTLTNPISICATGPESCGKSTLAQHLSEHLHITLISEYARTYLSSKGTSYDSSDIEAIAHFESQVIKEAHHSGLSFIKDTGIEVTKIWHEEKFGSSPKINSLWSEQQFDLYLLCAPSIPWEFDELRENSLDRDRLFVHYQHLLKSSPSTVVVVDQTELEQRLSFCLSEIEKLSQQKTP